MLIRERCVVDRREGAYWVLLTDEGARELLVAVADFPSLSPDDVLDIARDGQTVVTVTSLPEERRRRETEARARLSALFARGKDKNQGSGKDGR